MPVVLTYLRRYFAWMDLLRQRQKSINDVNFSSSCLFPWQQDFFLPAADQMEVMSVRASRVTVCGVNISLSSARQRLADNSLAVLVETSLGGWSAAMWRF